MNEQAPEKDLMDLDFTKQEDKVGDLMEKIEAANRGIKLAESMNDSDRVADLIAKRKSFEETLAQLTKENINIKKESANDDSYDWGNDERPSARAVI